MWPAFRRIFPLVVLGAAFIWSCVSITAHRTAEIPAGTRVIHIGHWQLESGVKTALDSLGKRFAELPETKRKYGNVVIMQDAIPESVYPQWVSCQMIGGSAPDILEWGMGLSSNIWLAYARRYALPLTELAGKPNPYNVGTPLEGVPLRNTFTDGMRSCYVDEMQEYMRVNLSRFTTRVFYNKSLFKKLTGEDEPPTNYRAFLAVCDKISKMRDPKTGKFYAPIASSSYNATYFNGSSADPMTFSTLYLADFNRDGTVGSDETFMAFKSGALSFKTPAMRAKLEIARHIQQYFQPGFTGLLRDDAVSRFAQQQSVFITSGTWDVGSLIEIAKGTFDVGIMPFPRPETTDPEYGSLALGPLYDPAWSAFSFSITRFHPENVEVAEDFLLYLASLPVNKELNADCGWIPSVKDVPLPGVLAKFAPVNQGIFATTSIDGIGGNSTIKWQQCFSELQTDPSYTTDDLIRDYVPYYLDKGMDDWDEAQRNNRRTALPLEQFLGGMRGELLSRQIPAENSRWISYRNYIANRQVLPDLWWHREQNIILHGADRPVGPYEFLPEAVAHLKTLATAPQDRP